ncbi:MAG: deoxyribonuclease IV [Patescibacteria group bacterium]|jgi:deoxyribonuclease-4
MLIGYHVSTSGGLYKAFQEAEALDCTAIQIFVGSPQMWNTPTISAKNVEKFKQAWKKSKVKKVLVHAAYLPNPSSHKASLRNFSLKKMKDEIKIAYAIDADGYNFHCGSNQDGNQAGTLNAIHTLNRLAELTDEKWPVKLIIESDAGAGNRIGDTIEELGIIWKGLKNKTRFGFTLDTCHMFVSGIDVRTKKNVQEILSKFDKLIGLDHLHFIHANDALFGLGSKKDRHANIGQGEIGQTAFKYWLKSPKLKKVAFILETPRSGNLKQDLQDILLLKKLARSK